MGRMKAISLVAIVCFSTSGLVSAFALELEKGIAREDEGWTELTRPIRQEHNVYPLAAYKDEQKGRIFAVRDGIFMFDADYVWLDAWPLTRWEEEYIEPEIIGRYHSIGTERGEPRVREGIGCFAGSPLRYGDFTQDGSKELVLFLGNELMVFSPQSGSVIFSATLKINDWLDKEESDRYLAGIGGIQDDDPQYQSRIKTWAAGNYRWQRGRAYRGYARLYHGVFSDADDLEASEVESELIVWRKFYESKLRNEEDGFHSVRDRLVLYQFVDGAYQEKDADGERVRALLDQAGLTWAKGFPRESECDGEEGQLIPEMHDPLLNDPDVLEGVDPETMTLIENEED
jgi:hypothetical protein